MRWNSQMDQAESWLVAHLRAIWVGLFVLSLLCFGIWFWTMLFWPSQDAERARQVIVLDNGRTLSIDFPVRFLADDIARPVYLTAQSQKPFSVTLEVPNSLPLTLVAVEPGSAIEIRDAADGVVTVTWPLTTSVATAVLSATQPAQSSSAVPTPRGVLPILSQPQTVSLYFKNARSEKSCQSFHCSDGFATASLKIAEGTEDDSVLVEIETVSRASWRTFAEKYSFLAVLPFLATVFLSLGKAYSDRQKSQRQEAAEKLEAFKQALSAAKDPDNVKKKWDDLKRHAKYLTFDDWERASQLYQFSSRKATVDYDATSFQTWADSWAGALGLALSAAEPGVGKPKAEDIYRYLRVFPLDHLSASAEADLRKTIEELSKPQNHAWPIAADSPENDVKEQPKTIAALHVFAAASAADTEECRYLFSDKAWFWRDHPVYKELRQATGSALIWGPPGCGRTALALALTRYAVISTEEHVLGIYHAKSATLRETQESLARELLNFICQRSTSLSKLDQENRDALARLLLSRLDSKLLLAKLSEPEPTQFDSEHATPEQKRVWQEQAMVTFRLLRQSLKRTEGYRPLKPSLWFDNLSHCARKLDFQRVAIALDMTTEQYQQWRAASMERFVAALRSNPEIPTQLVLLTPGREKDFGDARAAGIALKELTWNGNESDEAPPLVRMLRHRLMQRIIGSNETTITGFVPEGVQRALCKAAHHNPRRLALLWQHIAAMHPDKMPVTPKMVSDAEAAIPS